MKRIIYLILFPLFFVSCSNNEAYKNNAEAWVKTNILPYFENSSIDKELTQFAKIKDQIQCNEINKLLLERCDNKNGYIYSMFVRGVNENDSSLIDLSSRLKIIANSQEDVLSYSSDYTYISVCVKYKNKYMENGDFTYLVVLNDKGIVLNKKIEKKYDKELKMNIYLTEKQN